MKKFIKGFAHAFNGIEEALKQRNIKIQLICAVFAIILSIYLEISSVEWIAIIFSIFFVLVSEMLNSAIEETCNAMRDCLGAHYNSTKVPRDIAAGAVLLSSISSIIIALIVFFPKIFLQ